MDMSAVYNDPKYQGLPEQEKAKVAEKMLSSDPKFTSLPDQEKAKVLTYFVAPKSIKEAKTEPNQKEWDLKSMVGGIPEATAQMITGVVAKPVGELAGFVDIPLHAAGISKTEPENVERTVQESLTYKPTTMGGKYVADSPYNPFNVFGKVVESVAKQVHDSVGGGALGNGLAEAVKQAVGFVGVKGGAKIPEAIKNSNVVKQAALEVQKRQREYSDKLVNEGKQAGFTFTPSEVPGSSSTAKAAEAVSGLHVYHLGAERSQLHNMASIKNQLVTEKLARDSLQDTSGGKVPEWMPLHKETLDSFRAEHGRIYDQVESIKGDIPYTPQYLNDVASLNSSLAAAERQYPALVKDRDIETIKTALMKGRSTNFPAAMQIMRDLRFKANYTFKKADNPEALAKANIQRSAAGVIENLMDSRLNQIGQGKLMEQFRNSRENIAKSHEIEKAMGKGNHVSAMELAKSDAPLTGGLALIRDMAINHPKIMSDIEGIRGHTGGYAADLTVGIGAAMLGHPLIGAAAIATRPALRKVLLSKTGQKSIKTPDYDIGLSRKIAPSAIGVAGKSLALTPAEIKRRERQKERKERQE